MEFKDVNPVTVFYHQEKTTLRKLMEVADREIPKMIEEAKKTQSPGNSSHAVPLSRLCF